MRMHPCAFELLANALAELYELPRNILRDPFDRCDIHCWLLEVYKSRILNGCRHDIRTAGALESSAAELRSYHGSLGRA